MIEIPKTNTKNDTRTRRKSGGSAKISSVNSNRFASELTSAIHFDFPGSIDELMDELKDQEREFIDRQSLYELARYRQLVRKILDSILDEGFRTVTLKKRRADRADLSIVSDINKKLSDISDAITRSNKAFDLMKSIEEIRGLLLDLVS
jgi:uncharacterized protein YaaR (DUF327 family)